MLRFIKCCDILRHCFKLDIKTNKTVNKSDEVGSKEKSSVRTGQNKSKCFNEGDPRLQIKAKIDRPSFGNFDLLKRKVERNPPTDIRKLTENLGLTYHAIWQILQDFKQTCGETRKVNK